MAKMLPTYINPDVKSAAERKIFDLLKESTDLDSYTCIHSLGIARHVRKRQGEIDFVLIGNNIILCLEIKGGRVARDEDGYWIFKDRNGQVTKKHESPFVQVSTAMYSLQKDVEAKFGSKHGYLFIYGVLFPDMEFKQESPEWDKNIIFDLRDINNPISKYIDRVINYWKKKSPPLDKNNSIPKSEIVNYLRGNFEIVTPLWGEIDSVEERINYFTKEQYRAIDQIESNSRLLFSGCAGTGKTLLAVEKARRNFYKKQKTLLLCFNKFLAYKLQSEIAKIDPNGEFLEANSIHKYFFKTVNKSSLKTKLEKGVMGKTSNEIFNVLLPSLFTELAENGLEKIDSLIIDEGQDLLNETYLLALDSVLKGGLKHGNWTIFLDPGGQSKLFNRFSKESYDYLKNLGITECKLSLNVRNTSQIATQASIVSGFPAGETKIDGPKVEYKLCNDQTEMALKTVDILDKLISQESIPPSSITLLSPKKIGDMSLFSTGIKIPRYLVEIDEANIINFTPDKVYYASAQSFKGLENKIIIYTDIDSFNGDFSESVNYVAMTRARDKLYILMNKNLNKNYQERVAKFAENNER